MQVKTTIDKLCGRFDVCGDVLEEILKISPSNLMKKEIFSLYEMLLELFGCYCSSRTRKIFKEKCGKHNITIEEAINMMGFSDSLFTIIGSHPFWNLEIIIDDKVIKRLIRVGYSKYTIFATVFEAMDETAQNEFIDYICHKYDVKLDIGEDWEDVFFHKYNKESKSFIVNRHKGKDFTNMILQMVKTVVEG